MKQGRLVVVSGPSGAGKTSVMQRVFDACSLRGCEEMGTGSVPTRMAPVAAASGEVPVPLFSQSLPLVRSVSATTRLPRLGEADGVDYHFLTDGDFQTRRQRGDFLECFEVFGQGHWYGTLESEVATGLAAGKWVVLEIDVQGALTVMQRFSDAITIFIRPSSRQELERRLRGRGTETEEAIESRLARADRELALADRYQYQVINDNMDQAVQELCGILTALRSE